MICYELEHTGRSRHCCGSAIVVHGKHLCTLGGGTGTVEGYFCSCPYIKPPKDPTFFDLLEVYNGSV